jgi:hypothetical protein
MRLAILLLLTAVAVASEPATSAVGTAAAAPFAGLRAKRAWIVVIDGPRRSESWDQPGRPNIPRQAALAAQGTLYADFRNEGFTYTNAGHAALVTGQWFQIENKGNQWLPVPGTLQRYLRATGKPASACRLICSKDKLWILGDCDDPAWRGRWVPVTDCGTGRGVGPAKLSSYREDPQTHANVMAAIRGAEPPDLMVVNYKGPDAHGHANDWAGYLAAIRETDVYIHEIWTAVQADPRLRDSTAVFVTNDHGRHLDGVADGFVNHGDACEGCRSISLLALGPDFAPGRVITTRRGLADLGVTVASMAGVTLPGAVGRRMDELFAPAAQAAP